MSTPLPHDLKGEGRTADELICARGSLCLLEVLHHAMRVECIGDGAAKFEVKALGHAMGRHDECVLAHLVRVAVVHVREIPLVLVFASGGECGVELVGIVADREVDLGNLW